MLERTLGQRGEISLGGRSACCGASTRPRCWPLGSIEHSGGFAAVCEANQTVVAKVRVAEEWRGSAQWRGASAGPGSRDSAK